MDISSIRKEYKLGSLDISDVHQNPIVQFNKWFSEALYAEVNEPNAMVLSTVSDNMQPHSRVVLVKNISSEGFSFFTNYSSSKGVQLAENNRASLLFFWPELERQVRIEGQVKKISREASEKYFVTRPRESQIGAHVSAQSAVISSRLELENTFAELEKRFEGKAIPLPDYWGGYILSPNRIEFWQGRASRLHDRILYSLTQDNLWHIARLAP